MNRNGFILLVPVKWTNPSGSSLLINLWWKNKWNVCQPQDSLSVLGRKVTKLCVIIRDRILGPLVSAPHPFLALWSHCPTILWGCLWGQRLQNNSMCRGQLAPSILLTRGIGFLIVTGHEFRPSQLRRFNQQAFVIREAYVLPFPVGIYVKRQWGWNCGRHLMSTWV